jgi:hypothetical protein
LVVVLVAVVEAIEDFLDAVDVLVFVAQVPFVGSGP